MTLSHPIRREDFPSTLEFAAAVRQWWLDNPDKKPMKRKQTYNKIHRASGFKSVVSSLL